MLVLSLAFAHIPHDVVTGVALPTDLDPALPWLLLYDVYSMSALYRSEDAGATWNTVTGECLVDDLTDIAWIDGGGVVVLGEGRYWYTADGTSWSPSTLSIAPTAMAGGASLTFADSSGLWSGAPGGALTLEVAGVSVASLWEGNGGLVAVLTDGSFLVDGTAVAAGHAGVARSATWDGASLYAGYDDGTVWVWDGSWGACGTVPYAAEVPDHLEISRVASDGATVLATRAGMGPAASVDGCLTWSESAAPQENDWSGSSSTTTDEAFTALAVAGDTWLTAGYDGVSVADAGDWVHPSLKGPDFTHGFAFSADFSTDGAAIVAGHGGGVVRTFDGGATWDAPSLGLNLPDIQDVAIPPDAAGLNPAYALVNRIAYQSADDASSWAVMTGPWTSLRGLVAAEGGRLWALDMEVSSGTWPGDAALSTDSGATWSALGTLPASASTATLQGVIDRGSYIAAWTTSRVYRSTDGGATFATRFGSSAGIEDVVAWPDAAPTNLVVADGDGIWIQSGGTFVLAYDAGDAEIIKLLVTSDDTLFAATQDQKVLRSDDQGTTWYEAAQLSTQAAVMIAHPDFAAHGEILVGGADGAFRVDAVGADRWMAYQRIDDNNDYATCTGGCTTISLASAAIGGATRVPVGGTMEAYLRGTEVKVIGSVVRRSIGEVWIDGARAGTFNISNLPTGSTLTRVSGLTDAWHHVEVRVTARSSITVDGLEGRGASAPLSGVSGPEAPPADAEPPAAEASAPPEPSGCQTTAPAAARGAPRRPARRPAPHDGGAPGGMPRGRHRRTMKGCRTSASTPPSPSSACSPGGGSPGARPGPR